MSKCYTSSITNPVQHQKIKGLELVYGQVVDVERMHSDDWYYGHVPDGTKQGLFPRNYVHTVRCEVSITINALSVS